MGTTIAMTQLEFCGHMPFSGCVATEKVLAFRSSNTGEIDLMRLVRADERSVGKTQQTTGQFGSLRA